MDDGRAVSPEPRDAFEILHHVGMTVAAELDLDRAVQVVTDAATTLVGAQFGAFFYNARGEAGESYMLYALSGAPREAFAHFPMPRNTDVFAPTFSGSEVVRSDDITQDARYGRHAPHAGMPKGHLPVRSYLAVPVVSRSGEVLGGLFLGHEETARFDARSEHLVLGLAAQAAVAIDNARLYQKAQRELEHRRVVEAQLRAFNQALDGRVEAHSRELAELRARTRVDRRSSDATSEQFRLLVQGVVDYAIYMLDTNGRVTTWNPGARRIKGYEADEVLGTDFSRFYTPEALAAGEPERALRQARETGRVEMLGPRVRKDGTRFWASVIIDAVYDDDGQLAGFAKITRDITEQREAAKELELAREALFQAQKMEAIGQLTGGIAHDFNNMLAGMIGAMQMLERRIQQGRYEESGKYIGAALDAANRAAGLTSRLLAFGRRASLEMRPVDVNGAIVSMEPLLSRAVGENIAIHLNLTGSIGHARSDANQLESALLNLSINARDAMPAGGAITITTAQREISTANAPVGSGLTPGPYVVIVVRDTGVGMPPDVMEKAFDPFFTTKPSGVGTGLGLSMVYGFVKQSGGHVMLQSAPGAGVEVTIYLPVAQGDMAAAAPAQAVARGSGESVLVVEDDETVRMLIMDMLRELGYTAHEARDAMAALPLIESDQRIDLLVSDVGLPGMNGRQLAEMARQRRPDLRVLFLTGYVEHAEDRSSLIERGMDMMTKPFVVEALAEKIRSILRTC